MRRRTLLVDVAIAAGLAVVVLILAPGLAIVAILAVAVLLICAISFALGRLRQRHSSRRRPSRAARPARRTSGGPAARR